MGTNNPLVTKSSGIKPRPQGGGGRRRKESKSAWPLQYHFSHMPSHQWRSSLKESLHIQRQNLLDSSPKPASRTSVPGIASEPCCLSSWTYHGAIISRFSFQVRLTFSCKVHLVKLKYIAVLINIQTSK